MGFVDLHVHSDASDGTLSPAETVRLAAEAGLEAMALTDHDTTAGVSQAVQEGIRLGIEVIPGIEVSGTYEGHEIHILGLFIRHDDPGLLAALQGLQQRRDRRNQEMLRRFEAAGISFTPQELQGKNPDTIITRAHIARALIARGLVSSNEQAFKRYLNYGGPYCPPKENLEPEEIIRLILNSGGFAALAHPFQYKLGDRKTEELIARLAAAGMKGLEVYHSSCHQGESRKLREMASRHGLLSTGGSDFHGANKPDISIGTGRGNLRVSSLLLDQIKHNLQENPLSRT